MTNEKLKECFNACMFSVTLTVFFVLVFLALSSVVHAQPVQPAGVQIDLNAIAMIESSGCKNKVSKRPGDESYGCHQITPATLSEFNSYNKKSYTKNDLLNDAVSAQVAGWYLNKRIPSMIRHFKKADTIQNRLIAYNAGINYVKTGKPIPAITKKYLEKYARLTK